MRISTFKILLKQIGSLLIILGIIELIPIPVAVIYKEWYSLAGFFLSAVITLTTGFILYRGFYYSDDPHYSHYFIIAAGGWLGIALLGGLPYFLIAQITPPDIMDKFIPAGSYYSLSSLVYFKNPLHCFFESMSGFTTTGLTMAVHEPSVGKTILFYRSLSQWFGGAGFVVMVLAVFRQTSGRSAILLYGSESSGERLKPRVIETARSIWKVYLFVTVFSTIYLIIGTYLILPRYSFGDIVFDSINHAMAGQSTGGFSTLDESIAGYYSVYMDILYLLPMVLGSFSIPFYYKVIFKRKLSEIRNDIQTRSLIFAFILGSLILSGLLWKAEFVPNPLRTGIFQFISAMSTTGWQTSDIGNWNWVSIFFIVSTAMFIGGASGATVGGIKMIRALVIKRMITWQISKSFIPGYVVKRIKFNGKSYLPEEMNEEFSKAATLAICFFLLVIGSTLITLYLTSNEFSFKDALFESASAQGTVGLSAGITSPAMSPVIELIYIFQMWSGRLEIIPVFALIRAVFKGTQP